MVFSFIVYCGYKCNRKRKSFQYIAVASAIVLENTIEARYLYRAITVIRPRFLRGRAETEAYRNRQKLQELGHYRARVPMQGWFNTSPQLGESPGPEAKKAIYPRVYIQSGTVVCLVRLNQALLSISYYRSFLLVN